MSCWYVSEPLCWSTFEFLIFAIQHYPETYIRTLLFLVLEMSPARRATGESRSVRIPFPQSAYVLHIHVPIPGQVLFALGKQEAVMCSLTVSITEQRIAATTDG